MVLVNKTILVVDDDDALRLPLARGLRVAGFDVLTAADAIAAMEIMKRVNVDALVLDRMMVDMDGLSMLKQMRSDGNMTPTIMLTAMTGPENTIEGLMVGANDYLAKPFQLQELVLRLNNIIKQTPKQQQHLPNGLIFADNEFFIKKPNETTNKLFALSGEEKKLLQNLITPMGNIVAASPMVAKRLRTKINSVLSDLDIITIRGRGYKLVANPTTEKR